MPFGTNMVKYVQFLEELKARATHCRVFDPYKWET